MDAQTEVILKQQLSDRRERLQAAIPQAHDPAPLVHLLEEVDDALGRMSRGAYGLCVICNDPVEESRLLVDPLLRNCLDHLTPEQQRALEQDLDLAWRLQRELLPRADLRLTEWEIGYHYEPVGPVSGDYCDVIPLPDGAMFFALGDVSGKGIAASMMMSHLHAIFRSLGSLDLPLDEMMGRANRLFCESSMPAFFATLVCGRADQSGEVETCNAGHLPSLWVRGNNITRLEAGGLPLGLFCSSSYTAEKLHMEKGELLLLYTDGLSEARNPVTGEYGLERIETLAGLHRLDSPRVLVGACLNDLSQFLGGAPRTDDLAILAIRRQAPVIA
jgi:sigma-B regulation protein RsbU (phosphoserine phosphatase)